MPIHRPNDKPVSEKMYRDIFNEKFNISFFHPKKDHCELCSVFETATPVQQEKLREKYNTHIANKNLAQEVMKKEKALVKDVKNICFGVFDLQSVMYVPQCTTSVLFYKRKMSVYNFTISDSSLNVGYNFMWNESNASRGANEMASCLLKFVEIKIKEGITELQFWSDNCSAQNKNKYLYSMYTYLRSKYNVKIYHKYLETGHTYNDCDTMHSVIEKAARHKNIFVPSEWEDIVKDAKKTGEKFKVFNMDGEMKDFHQLAEQYQQWTHKSAKWSKVKEFHVTPLSPGKVFVKHDLREESYQEFSIRKAGRPTNLMTYVPPAAYFGPVQLKKNKLKDLASMCNDLVIPSSYHAFYKSLDGFPDLTNPLLEDDDGEEPTENVDDLDPDWVEEIDN